MSDLGPLQLNYLKRKREEDGSISYIFSGSPIAKKRRILLKNKCQYKAMKQKEAREAAERGETEESKNDIKKNKKEPVMNRLMVAFDNKEKLKLINDVMRKLIISENGEQKNLFSIAGDVNMSSVHFGESCMEWSGYREMGQKRIRPMYRIDGEYVDARKIVMLCFASREDLKNFCQHNNRSKDGDQCNTNDGLLKKFASKQIKPFCNNHECVNWKHHIIEHAKKFRWYKGT